MKLSVLAIPILASFAAAEIGDLCTNNGVYGTCQLITWCNANGGDDYTPNLCPDDPPDVKCCFAPDCHGNMGYCDITSDAELCEDNGGSFERNYCPGPSDYQCCVLNA